ncbi:hypothetical protein Ndes2526B_g07681 [Nannochloris sp. 'desiccata']
MHRVGNAPGFRSPAMPSQSMRRCAAVDMRPPLPHRVHLGGGLIPALPGHVNKTRVGPLRVSAPADMILSEYKEPAKGEDGTPWIFKAWKLLDFFVAIGFVVFVCHLGITHYNNIFQFLSGTATGNAITAASGLLGFSVKLVFDKIDALQAETKKLQAETRKELGLIAQALNSLRIELKTKFVEQDTNIAWMRGDFDVVNRGSGVSVQGTKFSSTQPSGEEERSPEGEDDAATNP